MAKKQSGTMPGGARFATSDPPMPMPKARAIIGVHVKKAKGGHVVSHSYKGGYYPGEGDQEHVFGKGQHRQLMNHVARKIGVPVPYGNADEASESAADEAGEGE